MGSTAGFILSLFNAISNDRELSIPREETIKSYPYYTAMSYIEILVIFGNVSCFYYFILKHFQLFW